MEERVEFTMSDVIPEELLAGLSDTDREMESINRPSISYWRNCWIRLKKDKLAMLGIAIVVLMTLAAIFVPMFSPYTYDQTDFGNALQWPNSAHLFGTDKMGRDIFVRTMYGARISLSIGFAAAAINMVIGVLYGGISGYVGGTTDIIMMRVVDILTGIPSLYLYDFDYDVSGKHHTEYPDCHVPHVLDYHGQNGPCPDTDPEGTGFCPGSQGLRTEQMADSDTPSDTQQHGFHHRDGYVSDSFSHIPGGVFKLFRHRYPGAQGQLGNPGQ